MPAGGTNLGVFVPKWHVLSRRDNATLGVFFEFSQMALQSAEVHCEFFGPISGLNFGR